MSSVTLKTPKTWYLLEWFYKPSYFWSSNARPSCSMFVLSHNSNLSGIHRADSSVQDKGTGMKHAKGMLGPEFTNINIKETESSLQFFCILNQPSTEAADPVFSKPHWVRILKMQMYDFSILTCFFIVDVSVKAIYMQIKTHRDGRKLLY